MRNKLQVTQNKYIRFCLKHSLRQHIGTKEFKKMNWLPIKDRVEQRVSTKVFKYWRGISPFYTNELFSPPKIRITLGRIGL